MSVLDIGILGPLEVRHEGRALDLGGPRGRTLLAVLVVRGSMSAEALVEALWGDDAPQSSIKTLQVAISRLRQALGPAGERIETTSNGYRLRLEPGELDADRFERAYASARGAAEALREALALWRGPALADLRYEPWAQGEIRRLEELRAVAIEDRIDADLALGDHSPLVAELEALVVEYPHRERLRAQQMLALYRAGRHADALAAYRAARDTLDAELGLEPGPELRRLEQRILTHDPALGAPAAALTGIPPEPPTPTVGRADDVAAVVSLLDGTRLLTLTGPGGVGKTRLAVEVARAAHGRFVSLASTATAEQIPSAVCEALAVARVPEESDALALDRALSREPVLLVLDNLEHLADAPPWVAALLEHHSGLRVLATSRHPVGIQAEQLYPVVPLDPAGGALELFANRARARDPSFALAGDEAAIVAICERVGGLPLAIELAAARLGVLTPAALAQRLDDALAVLDRGPRDAPQRQRTLRATLDWSFELVDDDERDAFTALGAFAGGCDLDAAEVVTGAGLDVLEGLAAKSLLTARDGRLTLLEPVRQYAAERLAARTDADAIHSRHLDHFIALAERSEARVWAQDRACPEFIALRRDHGNLRAAAAWGLASGEARRVLRLASALGDYMWFAHASAELKQWWDAAYAIAGSQLTAREQARAQLARGKTEFDFAHRLESTRTALALFRDVGDDTMTVRSLTDVSLFGDLVGEETESRAAAAEAVELARTLGDDLLLGTAVARLAAVTPEPETAVALAREAALRLRAAGALLRLAQMFALSSHSLTDRGEYELALSFAREGVELARVVDDPYTTALAHARSADAALLAGELDEARGSYSAELDTAHSHGFSMFYIDAFLGLAALAGADGDDRRAATLHAAAWALADWPASRSEKRLYGRLEERFIAPARERLGEPAWAAAQAEGRAMTAADAVGYALRPALLPH